MPRTKGVRESKPRAKGAGRPTGVTDAAPRTRRRPKNVPTYAERYESDPTGSTLLALQLTNAQLAFLESLAEERGETVQAWIRWAIDEVSGRRLIV